MGLRRHGEYSLRTAVLDWPMPELPPPFDFLLLECRRAASASSWLGKKSSARIRASPTSAVESPRYVRFCPVGETKRVWERVKPRLGGLCARAELEPEQAKLRFVAPLAACAPWKRAPALPSACSRSAPPNGRLVRLRQELPAEPELEPHQTGLELVNRVMAAPVLVRIVLTSQVFDSDYVFMWYLKRGVLLTKDNLARRNWLGSKICSFCTPFFRLRLHLISLVCNSLSFWFRTT